MKRKVAGMIRNTIWISTELHRLTNKETTKEFHNFRKKKWILLEEHKKKIEEEREKFSMLERQFKLLQQEYNEVMGE